MTHRWWGIKVWMVNYVCLPYWSPYGQMCPETDKNVPFVSLCPFFFIKKKMRYLPMTTCKVAGVVTKWSWVTNYVYLSTVLKCNFEVTAFHITGISKNVVWILLPKALHNTQGTLDADSQKVSHVHIQLSSNLLASALISFSSLAFFFALILLTLRPHKVTLLCCWVTYPVKLSSLTLFTFS